MKITISKSIQSVILMISAVAYSQMALADSTVWVGKIENHTLIPLYVVYANPHNGASFSGYQIPAQARSNIPIASKQAIGFGCKLDKSKGSRCTVGLSTTPNDQTAMVEVRIVYDFDEKFHPDTTTHDGEIAVTTKRTGSGAHFHINCRTGSPPACWDTQGQ